MKRIILFTLMLVLMSVAVSAATYNASYTCADPSICVEGEMVDWKLTIRGDKRAELISARIQEFDSGETIALKTYDRDKYRKLSAGETYYVDFEYEAPSKSVLFIPCFKLEITESGSDIKGDIIDVCDDLHPQNLEVLSLSDKMCDMRFGDVECGEGESCIGYRCVVVQCGECQYPKGGRCFDYECCDDSACAGTHVCENHMCTPIICPAGEAPQNHACGTLICADDQYALGGTCVDLTCMPDEIALNHRCEKLDCGIMQKAEQGECVASGASMVVLAIVLVIIVAFLALLAFMKHRKKHHFMEWESFQRKHVKKEKIKLDFDESTATTPTYKGIDVMGEEPEMPEEEPEKKPKKKKK